MEASHLNWTDAVVAAVIVGFAISGLLHGFVKTIFKIVSFFLSVYLAVRFMQPVSDLIMKTSLATGIKKMITEGLLKQSDEVAAQAGTGSTVKVTGVEFVQNLSIPDVLKDTVNDKLPNLSDLFSLSGIADLLGTELTRIVVSIIAFIVLFILINILLSFAKLLLKGITKLPILKQIDKAGGFAFGLVEGVLAIFIIMALIALLSTSFGYSSVYGDIDDSVIARFFYQNNPIIGWLFKK